MLNDAIQLFVSLGNPGEAYTHTRHNIGAWWLKYLATELNAIMRTEPKFQGQMAKVICHDFPIFLFQPDTFMNLSGHPVRAISQFYQIPPKAILVIHDELDFSAGITRLKQGGGHGGHNGLRNIIQCLGTPDFYRLRIGIGHPEDRGEVHDYVLGRPSQSDTSLILAAIHQSMLILPALVQGNIEKAMQTLHTPKL